MYKTSDDPNFEETDAKTMKYSNNLYKGVAELIRDSLSERLYDEHLETLTEEEKGIFLMSLEYEVEDPLWKNWVSTVDREVLRTNIKNLLYWLEIESAEFTDGLVRLYLKEWSVE